MGRYILRPFQQGDLDGLCGTYAILNALRVAYANRRTRTCPFNCEPPSIDDDQAEALFLRILRATPSRTIDDPVASGISASRLKKLMGVASRWLERNHRFTITVRRPFWPKRRPHHQTVLRVIREHLQKNRTAVIIGNRWPWRHWTVVRNVGQTRLMLADSGGSHYVPLQKTGAPHGMHAGLINAHEVFLIALRPRPD